MGQSSKQKKAAAKARRKQQIKVAGNASPMKNRFAELQEQNGQLQMSLLNMRQMYDQKVMESRAYSDAVAVKDQLITALIVDAGDELVLRKSAVDSVVANDYIGYEVEETEGEYEFTAIRSEVEVEEE